MGMLVPVFAAYLLLCFGIQYFREPREVGNGPLVSSYIFMFAAFLLLWDIRLYPRSLRKLGIVSQGIIEFLIASFLFENIMVDFWFPLEVAVLGGAPKLADLLEEMLQTGDWGCDGVCDVLRNDMTSYTISYLLSTFFLLAVLHATRAIDLRLLEQCGPQYFISDIISRAKRFFRKQKKYLGIGMKKKVFIKEGKKGPCSSSKTSIDSSPCPGMSRRRSSSKSSSKSKKGKSKGPCDTELKYTFSDFEMGLKDDF